MKKRIIISAILIILILIITKCSLMIKESRIEDNLKANSVYFAKNMPKSIDKINIISILLDNLNYIKDPKIQGIKIDVDGTHIIRNLNFNKNDNSFLSKDFSHNDNSYIYTYMNDKNILFYFNNDFTLKYVQVFRENKNIEISTVDEKAIIDEIYEYVKPIIDAQTEPEENLQEEFNKRYKDRFN